MSNTVLAVLVIGAGVLLAGLVLLLLRSRRTKVIAAPASPAAMAAVAAPADAPPPVSMTMAAADSVVRAMIARGEKIEAIKMVREMTGLGLKEAKDYVEALPNAPPLMAVARQMVMASSAAAGGGASVRTEAAALAMRGQLLEAVKLVRERTGMGLKEAKEYVDAIAADLPPASGDARSRLDDPRLRQSVAQMLAGGQHEQAMRFIQSVTGCSIEAARHYIDQIRQAG